MLYMPYYLIIDLYNIKLSLNIIIFIFNIIKIKGKLNIIEVNNIATLV